MYEFEHPPVSGAAAAALDVFEFVEEVLGSSEALAGVSESESSLEMLIAESWGGARHRKHILKEFFFLKIWAITRNGQYTTCTMALHENPSFDLP